VLDKKKLENDALIEESLDNAGARLEESPKSLMALGSAVPCIKKRALRSKRAVK
jgi:hypothetical protein